MYLASVSNCASCVADGLNIAVAFNAANEIAVQGFFDRKIKFTQIPQLVDSVLDLDWTAEPKTVADVYEIDRLARDAAKNGLESIGDGK